MIQEDKPRVEGTWMHSLDWLCNLLPKVELKFRITKCWILLSSLCCPSKNLKYYTLCNQLQHAERIALWYYKTWGWGCPKKLITSSLQSITKKKRWNEMLHNRLKQHHWSNISPKEPQIGAETERPLSPCTLIIFFKISQGGLSHYSQLQKLWSKNACILSWAYGTFWTRWVSTTNRFQLPTNLEHELPLRI